MVTARFRVLYVFVALEVGTRQILHWNVTEHPTAEWTIQQFRTVMTPETSHRFVLHAAADVASDSLRIDQVRRDGGEHQIDGRFQRSHVNGMSDSTGANRSPQLTSVSKPVVA